MFSEQDIRKIVAQVVEESLGESGAASSLPVSSAQGLPAAAPEKSLAIGSDHGGFALKEELVTFLRESGFTVTDCGTDSTAACDYPDFAHEVARRVADGFCRYGIIVDGAGIGSCMVANKVPGVRAALCYDLSSARNSREHNHANVLTLGAGLVGPALARQIVATWLATPWGPARHGRRVDLITAVEQRYLKRQGE